MSRDLELAQIQNQICKEENEELRQQIRHFQEKVRKQDGEMESLVDTLDENARVIMDLREKNRLLRDENVNDISRVDEFIANLKSMNVFQFVEFVKSYEEGMSK